MRNILFLDIDGVLNRSLNYRTYRWLCPEKRGTESILQYLYIDDILVDNLKTIYNQCDIQIVISSTWREDKDVKEQLIKVLEEKEMSIYDMTPILENKKSIKENRVNEINRWKSYNICTTRISNT